MTRPADPSRPGTPTAWEIAALTARLRNITARGGTVDAVERARFLADKDALIARITDTTTDGGRAAMREPALPESMREQACAIEAAIEAVTLSDVYPDDTPARAARITALRAEQAAHTPEPEQERREQLVRWHADDQAAGQGDRHEDALDRSTGGPTPQGDNP